MLGTRRLPGRPLVIAGVAVAALILGAGVLISLLPAGHGGWNHPALPSAPPSAGTTGAG